LVIPTAHAHGGGGGGGNRDLSSGGGFGGGECDSILSAGSGGGDAVVETGSAKSADNNGVATAGEAETFRISTVATTRSKAAALAATQKQAPRSTLRAFRTSSRSDPSASPSSQASISLAAIGAYRFGRRVRPFPVLGVLVPTADILFAHNGVSS